MLRDPIIALAIGAAAGACAIMIAMFYWPGFATRLIVLVRAMPGIGRFVAKVGRLLEEIAYFRTHHRVLLLSLVYSFTSPPPRRNQRLRGLSQRRVGALAYFMYWRSPR